MRVKPSGLALTPTEDAPVFCLSAQRTIRHGLVFLPRRKVFRSISRSRRPSNGHNSSATSFSSQVFR